MLNNNLNVSQIKVEKLFGLYDYTLKKGNNNDINKLMIIYGDNGTGKTTILKLFFYLLSTKDRSGYKSRISEYKFKKISVFFQNGFEISAAREKARYGSYEFYIAKNKKKIKSIVLNANNNVIQLKPDSEEDLVFQEILAYIRNLNITTFYLSDDRKILNSLLSNDNEEENSSAIYNHSDIIYSKSYERIAIKKLLNEKRLGFEPTIERLIDWIRNKVIYGSRQGETNSQVIFSDIIKNYITLAESEVTNKIQSTLLKELEDLEIKIESFVRFGLIDNIDIKSFKSSIKKAKTPEQINLLHTVVSLFLDSINAKLNALEYVVKTINLFLQTINDYFVHKRIEFHLSTGFILKQTHNNEEIDFNWLSSGEKQLMLLLINTITAADDATIFIIDEPEISLNIKWQRKLINTLLDFSEERNIQFILATHSFELLSSYKNSITKLISENA